MTRFVFSVLTFLFVAFPAQSQTDPGELARRAAQQLDAAHLALSEANRASDRVAALSQTIRAYEDGLIALRESLRRAAMRETAIRREFEAESQKVSQFLGVLLTIQTSAGPLMLLHPSGPLGTVRSGMIVSEVTPAIQAEAEELRAKLEEVALLRALQESAADALLLGLSGVQQARTDLSQAVSNRKELPKRFLSDPAQIQTLIDSAETLHSFASGLAKIDVGASEPESIRGFRAARGSLPLPVAGTLLRGFNEPDAAGIRRSGILVATRPLAIVTAPWPATLRYSGPLLDYGNVMILEPEANTLLVLAGLGEVYGEVGQVIAAGTALGLMGGATPMLDTILLDTAIVTGSEQTETLYIELRTGAEPVDPAEWFVETKE
ncbi:MAG: peptidase M23 [Marinosulfonomonas sp.]|nr:peptidase M23 [Marinosulfonomonas sp.]